jgi:NADPH:quinone reductase-like Zn-dependent oxidoreductase
MNYKSVVISGSNIKYLNDFKSDISVDNFFIENTEIGCGLLNIEDIFFDKNEEANRNSVLVQKLGFSCNYRDKGFLLHLANHANENYSLFPNELLYSCIGSDFVAEVIEKGDLVNSLEIGDLVIPDNSYPFAKNKMVLGGIPTNEASSRQQIISQYKLIRIPANFNIEFAAALSIGAQTAYSILGKIKLNESSKILVTSATSNTSLFILSFLNNLTNVYVMTSSSKSIDKLTEMGVKNANIILVDYSNPDLFSKNQMRELLDEINGFDVVIDPFIDIYLHRIIDILSFNAQYISCGIFNQHPSYNQAHIPEGDSNKVYLKLIEKNIHLIGNCLGSSEDLKKAIKEISEKKMKIPIDSIFKEFQIADFFDRTFNSKERFGKVVYIY